MRVPVPIGRPIAGAALARNWSHSVSAGLGQIRRRLLQVAGATTHTLLRNSQTRHSVPLLASTLGIPRGSRQMPRGI